MRTTLSWLVVKFLFILSICGIHYHRPCLIISFLPNRLLMKKWRIFGREFQITKYPWRTEMVRPWQNRLWKNLNLSLGKLGEVAIRWDNGYRCYIAVHLWLCEYKRHFTLPRENRYGRWEFFHEIWQIGNQFPVSKWWWGDGWLRVAVFRGNLYNLYRHFGKLIRWRWKDKYCGLIGVALAPEHQDEVWRMSQEEHARYCVQSAQALQDAVLGTVRNQMREAYPAICNDCGSTFDPHYPGDGPRNWDHCPDCQEKIFDAMDEAS